MAFENVSLAFDDNVVLREVSFAVHPGHMSILLGGSGSGKSVVLKLILGLLKPDSGVIRINGTRIDTMSEKQMLHMRDDIGMLFQESALFDSLTVADNVGLSRRNRHAPTGSAGVSRRSGLHRVERSHRQMPSGSPEDSAAGASRAISAKRGSCFRRTDREARSGDLKTVNAGSSSCAMWSTSPDPR